MIKTNNQFSLHLNEKQSIIANTDNGEKQLFSFVLKRLMSSLLKSWKYWQPIQLLLFWHLTS